MAVNSLLLSLQYGSNEPFQKEIREWCRNIFHNVMCLVKTETREAKFALAYVTIIGAMNHSSSIFSLVLSQYLCNMSSIRYHH